MERNTWSASSYFGDVRFYVCPQVSKRASRDGFAERGCQNQTIQYDCEKNPGIRMAVLGHCEAAIKDVEKQIRATLFQMYADYHCNSDKFPAELPIFPGCFDMLRGHSHGMRSKVMVKPYFSS